MDPCDTQQDATCLKRQVIWTCFSKARGSKSLKIHQKFNKIPERCPFNIFYSHKNTLTTFILSSILKFYIRWSFAQNLSSIELCYHP